MRKTSLHDEKELIDERVDLFQSILELEILSKVEMTIHIFCLILENLIN